MNITKKLIIEKAYRLKIFLLNKNLYTKEYWAVITSNIEFYVNEKKDYSILRLKFKKENFDFIFSFTGKIKIDNKLNLDLRRILILTVRIGYGIQKLYEIKKVNNKEMKKIKNKELIGQLIAKKEIVKRIKELKKELK